MSGIFDLLQAFPKVRTAQKQFADDRVDKLNRSLTVIIFLSAAVFILSRSFGSTIVCLPDGTMTLQIDMAYVNAMCFAQGTYKIANFHETAKRNEMLTSKSFSYPWLALIAAAIAFLFYVPYLIWKHMVRSNSYQHVPIDISGVVKSLKETSSLSKKSDEFAEKMKSIGAYMDRSFALNNFQDGYLDEYSEYDVKSDSGSSLKRPKSYRDRINKRRFRILYIPLLFKYLTIKLFYLAISIGVFPLIDILFGFKTFRFYQFGYEISTRMADIGRHAYDRNYSEYMTSQYFPRHTMCELKIHGDAYSPQDYFFQCGLPANIFNEIVFLIIWFWLVMLILINTFSLLSWLFVFSRRRSMIKDILLWPFRYNYHIDKFIDSFVYDYLSSEGFLVMMLIKANAEDWHCRILTRILWKLYMDRINAEQSHTDSYDAGV